MHLIDISPLHVQIAQEASVAQPGCPLASASIGDARSLAWPGGAMDAALRLGPLYHLTRAEDRRQALRERLLHIARTLETEPAILGVSAHVMAVATK